MKATVATKKAARQKGSGKRPPAAAGGKWILRRAGGLQILEAPALARIDWLVHGFSTRAGGASELASSDGGEQAKNDRGRTSS